MSSHSNPFPHLQCISTNFPFTLTHCQITAAAYDGQKHIFATVHENGTLLDSLSLPGNTHCLQGKCILVVQCVTSQVLHLLSSVSILESSWIRVSFIKHKIRKTVHPILCRFRKKVPLDLFGWTACWSKSFKADLSSWICMKALPLQRTSLHGEIELTLESTKLKSESDYFLVALSCCVSYKVGDYRTLIYILLF